MSIDPNDQEDYTLSGSDDGESARPDIEFQFEKTGEDLESYIHDFADTVRVGLDQSIAILTPWFFNNLPRMYYQTTPRAEKVRHLSAVITGHVFETKQTVELWDHNQTKVTYIGPGSYSNILIEMAQKVKPFTIKLGSLYFSRDRLLFLSTFYCKEHKNADVQNEHVSHKIDSARKQLIEDHPKHKEEVKKFLENIDHDFVVYATPSRIALTFKMMLHMQSHEGAHTVVEPFKDSPTSRLTLGFKGIQPSQILEHIFQLINIYGFDIVRFFTVQFEKNYPEAITVMHIILRQRSLKQATVNEIAMVKLIKALRTLGWSDSDDYNQFFSKPLELSINAVNLIRAIATWIHVLLGKENIYYYSEYKIYQTFRKQPEITQKIVNLFRLKFNPLNPENRENDGYSRHSAEAREIISQLLDKVERNIFFEAVHFCDHVLKTNYFLPTKTGLAFRIDPKILDEQHYPEKPFGIFYIIGRDYRFFQIRWKDVARGGLRVVMPKNDTDYGYAISGIFDEVYGLSHAQQLKNKDIPEGGSKAVLVLKPNGHRARAVRGGINAMLDLLVSDDEIHEEQASKQVSYLDQNEEIIYLGPDENMTNDLITWVPEQAERRKYKYAKAFISSKPGTGINHKEYGVTSEGVHVFVDHTLHFIGLNPKEEPFTVKMTGGPDGDVAGNELKILHREYGKNAKIIAIADGFGAAYDPKGLNWDELLRLVEQGLSINHFNPRKLSKDSEAFAIEADTTQNIHIRNRLHFTTKADIFIPAGGRPYTVNSQNWRLFIDKEGKPSCKAVIEGANIFFTEEARKGLQESGVLMIKDSSANKTGVICSSFEVIASLILSDEEYLEIKEQYVAEVVDILRKKAAAEAKLLFHEYTIRRHQTTLIELSLEISKEINDVTDTLLNHLTEEKEKILADKMFQDIVLLHCPPILRKKYANRIREELPQAHQIAIISAYIASFIVYNEGLGWLESLGEGKKYTAAITYMNAKIHAEYLMGLVKSSKIESKESLRCILERSAARDLTIIELEKQVTKKSLER